MRAAICSGAGTVGTIVVLAGLLQIVAPLRAQGPQSVSEVGTTTSPTVASSNYVGDAGNDLLVSAQADAAGNLFLLARTQALPTALRTDQRIVAAERATETVGFCVLHKRSPAGAQLWSLYFEGFSLCDAMAIRPSGDAVLALRSTVGNFGDLPQILTISGDTADSLAIDYVNGSDIGRDVVGRATLKDIKADRMGNVYLLYDALVGSELQGRVLRIDTQGGGIYGPVDIGFPTFTSAAALAVDDSGHAFVVGKASMLTTTPDAFQPTRPALFSCTDDGFLVQVDMATLATVYASYLGGTGCDAVKDVAVAAGGTLYLYGTTTSSDFPMGGTPLHGAPESGLDGFIVQMDLGQPAADQLRTGTFLELQLGDGSPGVRDVAHPLAILPGGAIALTGTSAAADFPLVDPLFDATGTSGLARFVQVYSPDLSALLFSSHLDTSGVASHSVIAAPGDATLYAVTQTSDSGLGNPPGAPAGGTDLFVTRIDLASVLPGLNHAPVLEIVPTGPLTATSPSGVQTTIFATAVDPDGDPLTVMWTGPFSDITFPLSGPYDPGRRNGTVSVLLPIGVSGVTLTATDSHGLEATLTVPIEVTAINTVVGAAQTVAPIDAEPVRVFGFTPGRMTFTFDNITKEGLTYFRTRMDQTPPPPADRQLGSAPLYYDAGTMGVEATGDIRVCIDSTGMSFASSPAWIYRLGAAGWENITTPAAPAEDAAHSVCGVVHGTNELTTFALFTAATDGARVATIAGNGEQSTPGHPAPGDGGPASAAPLGFLNSIALDSARGYLYVPDDLRIRRVNLQNGTIDTIAGTGRFDSLDEVHYGVNALETALVAGDIAVDRDGNLFLSDVNGCGIARIDHATNIITRVAGVGWDPATLQCGNPSGDAGPATAAHLDVIGKMAFDPHGNLYFPQLLIGAEGQTIRRIAAGADGLITGDDPDEVISTVAGGGHDWPPADGDPRLAQLHSNGLTFDPNGDLYIASDAFVFRLTRAPGKSSIDGDADERITRVAGNAIIDATVPFQGDAGPALDANLGSAWDVAVLPSGDLVVADGAFNRLRRITTGGDGVADGIGDERIETVAGFTQNEPDVSRLIFNGDGYALSTAFNNPRAVILDPHGGVLVADAGFRRVRHVGLPEAISPASADLSLVVTAAPNPVDTDATLTYSVSIRNSGPSAATNVALTLSIGTGVEVLVPDLLAQCSAPAPGDTTLRCGFDSMPASFSQAFSIKVKPTVPGTLTTQFNVVSDLADPVSGNNSASTIVTVNPAPITIQVNEQIHVSDAVVVQPAAQVAIAETIHVQDTPQATPAAQISIAEGIHVQDAVSFPSLDTTPPVAVLDVSPQLVAGQSVLLSGSRSTDVGGTIARFRWQLPNDGIDVETTAPTYVVPASANLSAGSHAVSLIVTDSSGNASPPATATVTVIAQQAVTPLATGRVTSVIQTIDDGPGDQNDPHVDQDLMSYTDSASGIQYFRFSTGTAGTVPSSPGGFSDSLSDVNGNRIAFTRYSVDRIAIEVFDVAAASLTEIEPQAASFRVEPRLGSDTLAFDDVAGANVHVVVHSLSAATHEIVDATAETSDLNAVSPDGNTVVWTRCGAACDIYVARRALGTWSTSPAAATPEDEETADTDGTWIVYDRFTAGGPGIYFRLLVGGPEMHLALPGVQRLPRISRGVISFLNRPTPADQPELFVYDIATNLVYQVTSASTGVGLHDISVLDNGDARVVWSQAITVGNPTPAHVYATTFPLLSRPTLTVAPATAAAGRSATLSATLTAQGQPVAGQRVGFQLASDPAVAFATTDINGVATLPTTIEIAPGAYPGGVHASFAGDTTLRLAAATASADLTVTKAGTTMTVSATPNPAEFGTPVTFTVGVSSGFGIPTGDVIFSYRDGGVFRFLTAPVHIDTSGVATLLLPNFFMGDTEVRVDYMENAIYLGSQASMVMHVTKARTSTALASSRNPSITTGPPVFIATIASTVAPPSDARVEFFADGVLLCRSTVFARGPRFEARCGGAPLAVGSHSITATFVGDATFASSSAAPFTQAVQPGAYFMLDLGFTGEAVAVSPHGWVTGNSQLKSQIASALTSNAYVHDGTTTGAAVQVPSLGGSKTVAVGVDDSGHVAGSSATAGGATHVFLFDGTVTNDHHNPAFGGANSRATAMNADGVIVGFEDTASGFHAFVDVRGGAVDLGTIAGGSDSAAAAISQLPYIAGISTIADGSSHAALFGEAAATDIGTLGGATSAAVAVNNAGEAAGFSDAAGGARHAFIYRDGLMTDIGSSLGSAVSRAAAINDAAQAAGTFEDGSTGFDHAFLHSLDTTTDLGAGSFAALNNAGEVVTTASGVIFVRTGGSIQQIGGGAPVGTHLPPAVNATAMNDEGRIAGSIVLAGTPRGVLWIPVPLGLIAVNSVTARAGASAALTATLTSSAGPVANKMIAFRINGIDAGFAATDATGMATVPVVVPALAEGSYPEAIDAAFAGDDTLSAALGAATLTVLRTNTAPVLTVPGALTAEATSPLGAVVTFTATAIDAEDGQLTPVCVPASGSTFVLGTTGVTCTATDSDGASASIPFSVTVRDTTPPVVTAPPPVTVPATEAGGARAAQSALLSAFLNRGSAIDLSDPSPAALPDRIGSADVTATTLFPIGKTTTVTFRFRDANGNVGTATSTVSVVLGKPKLAIQVLRNGTVPGSSRKFVDLEVVNSGTGNARQAAVLAIALTTVKGTGVPTLVSPAVPLPLGDLDVGARTTIHVEFTVPSTVKTVAISESGTSMNVKGAVITFVQKQRFAP